MQGNFQRVVQIHLPARQRRAQRHAFDELGGYELPVALRGNLVNRENIRMIQRRGGACLGFEPAQLCLVRRQALWEKLERNLAPESLVSRQIDLAHSAGANERLDPVMTDRFAHHRAGPVVSQKLQSNFEGR